MPHLISTLLTLARACQAWILSCLTKVFPFFMTLQAQRYSLCLESIFMQVWFLTYASPLVLPELQPWRWAEAANLPLNLLTTILTVGKRACPGVCRQEHQHKKQTVTIWMYEPGKLIFSLSLYRDQRVITHLRKIHPALRCNHWDSSTCNFHSCSCSGAHRDEVSGHTHSDL